MSPYEVKSENYLANTDAIIDILTPEGAAYVIGGMSDNANDARKEMISTVDEIHNRNLQSNNPNIRELSYINGERIWPIVAGDPYHIGNLGVQHASIGMAGDTGTDQRQCHHLQALISQHSLHSDNPSYSQAMMDRVMAGTGRRVKMATWRERRTRWLVNQRNAAHVLSLMPVLTAGGVVCLVAWALYFANNSRNPWKGIVGKEIALWLSMSSIILGLHFESELRNYFEQCSAWNNRKGPFHKRSGFGALEFQDYFWDFEMAWWNAVVDCPSKCMPVTMKFLDDDFKGSELTMRCKQVKRGLRMGRDEIIKMMKKNYLQVPIILLTLTNKKRGASFLRAVLSVFHNFANMIPTGVALVHDLGGNWGTYKFNDPTQRPDDEKLWYNHLSRSIKLVDRLIQYWRILSLNAPILTQDLQVLSKKQEDSFVCNNGSPLPVFATDYPILFECLYATFGAMMSNNRLDKQIHGMMRFGLRQGMGMDQVDHQRQYSVRTDYVLRRNGG